MPRGHVAAKGAPSQKKPGKGDVMTIKEKDYFTALYEVARVINASLEPSEVLEKITCCVMEAMGVKACSIRLLDAKGKRLLMGAACGLSKGYLVKGPVLVKESGIDRGALGGKTIWIQDAQSDRDFQYTADAKKEKIRSILVVPLVVGKKAIGVLRAYTKEERKFDKQEVRFLEAVANLSAIALDNARLYNALKTNFELLVEHKYRIDDN
jgi:signal transduction protein with GAF and PtsI domain